MNETDRHRALDTAIDLLIAVRNTDTDIVRGMAHAAHGNPKATDYQTTGSHSSEPRLPVRLTPTGQLAESTAHTDRADYDARIHAVAQAAIALGHHAHRYCPNPTKRHTDPQAGEVPEDWCPSCYRINHHHSPRQIVRQKQTDGTYKHVARKLCSWCDGIKREYGRIPEEGILGRHLAGERLSAQTVEKAMRQRVARNRKGRNMA